jgi:hypothetical protein
LVGDLPNVSGRSKELKGPQTLSSSACTREKKKTRHKCRGGFGGGWCGRSGHGWCRRVGEDMGNTPPKFGVGGWGVRCGGQSAVKVTEKKNEKNWSHWYTGGSTIEAFPVESETRPLDHKYLRKASTCPHIDNFTLI